MYVCLFETFQTAPCTFLSNQGLPSGTDSGDQSGLSIKGRKVSTVLEESICEIKLQIKITLLIPDRKSVWDIYGEVLLSPSVEKRFVH